ncbi:hypothetical protein S83_052001 [Arachis hypogaea]
MERRTLMPHMATLLGFYRKNAPNQGEQQEQEVKFAGTVEVFFDQRDANTSMPSPLSLMENWRRAVVVWDAWRYYRRRIRPEDSFTEKERRKDRGEEKGG